MWGGSVGRWVAVLCELHSLWLMPVPGSSFYQSNPYLCFLKKMELDQKEDGEK